MINFVVEDKVVNVEVSGIDMMVKAAALPYNTEVKDGEGLALRVWNTGHRSIGRHTIVAIEIENMSQNTLRQISRHPHINLTGKSSRYCDMRKQPLYLPRTNLKKLSQKLERDYYELEREYYEDMEKIMTIYRKWKDYEGDAKEVDVAKKFLPLASTTNLVVSGNIQAIYEFLQLRNCVRAEDEIRTLSRDITTILANHENKLIAGIFGKLGCKGDVFGICPEGKLGCGKFTKKERKQADGTKMTKEELKEALKDKSILVTVYPEQLEDFGI